MQQVSGCGAWGVDTREVRKSHAKCFHAACKAQHQAGNDDVLLKHTEEEMQMSEASALIVDQRADAHNHEGIGAQRRHGRE